MAYQSIPDPSSSSSGFHLFNSPFGDTTSTKVFVGGLAWETQSETMCCYFDQFEDILEAVVITNRITRRSKGYGFVRHLRAMTPYFASGQSSRPYIGSPSYHQPVTYNYQQGFAHPQYG
ncbi:hypothetical protein IFM89_025219 [Coptis chinensis]|uniref:RRM domain-containing protein n=1 Tax=Coptis chinensis TaxID=261450 RepID=A0A835LF29_9MAGN|nr:hypothetical protein IFM89_025219 [Coptis chinensis]